MSKIILAPITAFLLLGAARAAEEFELAIPTLKEGSDAPALKVSKWVKGGPVVLADGKGKQIHIVEFWATWCPPCVRSIPHLTKIAQRFGKSGVTVVGISIDGEGTREKVEPFVKNMGPKMDYNVALDDADAMKKAYLDAAEAQGIPHAFIVGKDGRIAWQGHPMDGLDLKIAEMVGDKDYAEGAKKEKELQENLQNAAEGEDWAKALAAMDGLLTLHPEDTDLLVGKYRVLTLQKAAQPAAAWGREILKRITDIEPLNGMAWMILTEEEFTEGRDLELAMAVVKKANELSEGKNWSVLDTLARALFETKSPAEAVKIQEKAIGLAKEDKADEEAMEQMQASLEKYRTATGGAKPADAPAAPSAAAGAAGTTGTTEPGFMSLFDGKDITKSFVIKGSAESWKAGEEGILASIPGGDRIVSKEKFGDFTLRLEWRVSKGGNSGVFVRVPSQDDGAPWETGFEIQISNEGRDDAHCTGSLYGVEAVKPRPDETPGIWHSSEITCLGGRIAVKSDGVRCIDASSDKSPAMQKRPLEGFIGLQDSHSGPGSTIEYRNIRIRRLAADGTAAGFTHLTAGEKGWRRLKTGHGSGGRWIFEENAWAGEQDPPGSGNGGINATEGLYGDFEFILEAKPAWGGDSGLFLRSTDDGKCYQVMVDYYPGGEVGGIYGEGLGGFSQRAYTLQADKSMAAAEKSPFKLPFAAADWKKVWNPDDFNEVSARITGNPPTIDVWINGFQVNHYVDDQKRLGDTGRFGLQVHGGDRWPKGDQARYRKIQVREIGK